MFTLNLSGSDADVGVDGDTIAYSVADAPAGSNLNTSTGVFTWTPPYDAAASYAPTFTVTD